MKKTADPVAQEAEKLPEVRSPYEGTILRLPQHLAMSAYWFATNFLWGALLLIMLPAEIKHMAPKYRAETLGLLTGSAAIVALVVPLVAGALSDRCTSRWGRRRPFMLLGIVINLVGLAGMAIAFEMARPIATEGLGVVASILKNGPLLFFFLMFLVVQLGNNIASAAFSGVIPDLVPSDQRGAASGYFALMSQLGTLLGALGSSTVFAGRPETVKYGLLGFTLLAVSLFTLFGIKETPLPYKPPKLQWGPYLRSLWINPRKYPDFAWVWITRALVMLGFYSVLPYINYYLVDVIGIENPEVAAGKLTGALLLASSISGIYGGYLSDRLGRKRVVYIANVVIAVMSLAFIFCRNLEQVLAAGVVFGLGFGAYTSVDWALGTDVLPSKKDAGKEMAVWHVAMTLPQALAAPAGGFLIAAFGKHVEQGAGEPVYHYTTAGYSAIFVLCAVCFSLGAYLLKNVRGVR